MSVLSVLDPAVNQLHQLVVLVAAELPGPGATPLVLSLVLLTLLIRALLLPLAVRAFRGNKARAALAPELAEIRAKHGANRERLTHETLAAHRRAGVSPVAGMGATLLQAPVITALYRLAMVMGAPLNAHWLPTVAAAGIASTSTLLLVGVLLALLALAYLSSRQVTEGPRLLRLLPYGTVAFALVTPVAVSAYLVSSTAWSVTERALLARSG